MFTSVRQAGPWQSEAFDPAAFSSSRLYAAGLPATWAKGTDEEEACLVTLEGLLAQKAWDIAHFLS